MTEALFDDPEQVDDVDDDAADACMCEWRCNGMGGLVCDGCGGDQCVCVCGGEDGGDCDGDCDAPTCPVAGELLGAAAEDDGG